MVAGNFEKDSNLMQQLELLTSEDLAKNGERNILIITGVTKEFIIVLVTLLMKLTETICITG